MQFLFHQPVHSFPVVRCIIKYTANIRHGILHCYLVTETRISKKAKIRPVDIFFIKY